MSNNRPLILQQRVRIPFDVSNPEHRSAYYMFRRQGKWGVTGCPFEAVWPHTNVPAMCEASIFEYLASRDLEANGIADIPTTNMLPNVRYDVSAANV